MQKKTEHKILSTERKAQKHRTQSTEQGAKSTDHRTQIIVVFNTGLLSLTELSHSIGHGHG